MLKLFTKPSSLIPMRADVMMRWPVEETGRNSVRPSTKDRISTSKNVMATDSSGGLFKNQFLLWSSEAGAAGLGLGRGFLDENRMTYQINADFSLTTKDQVPYHFQILRRG